MAKIGKIFRNLEKFLRVLPIFGKNIKQKGEKNMPNSIFFPKFQKYPTFPAKVNKSATSPRNLSFLQSHKGSRSLGVRFSSQFFLYSIAMKWKKSSSPVSTKWHFSQHCENRARSDRKNWLHRSQNNRRGIGATNARFV